MAKIFIFILEGEGKIILKVELILWEFYFYIFLMVQQDDSVPRLTLEAGYQFKCVSVWEQSPSHILLHLALITESTSAPYL